MTEYEFEISDHHADLAGRRLFARRWRPARVAPEAPPIVLFHDSLGCVELWRDFPFRLAFAAGLPVVAYDRLGFGRSDPNPERLTRDFMTREIETGFAALRAHLRIGPFVAFGHSAGGGMAVCAGAAHPESCLAVVTAAAQAFVEARTLEGIRAAKLQFADPERMARLARHHGEKAPWALDAWTETWLAPDFADWTLDAELALLKSPLLALHGDRDEYGSAAQLERLAARAGGPSAALLLEDCGHSPHRERLERVLEATAGFLAPIAAAR